MAPTEKLLKASLKEGGKKGQDLAGMRDMGGVKFFSVGIESANGEWKLMDAVLQGMNKKVDETADDRKGGAGDIGKCLLHANDAVLLMLCHVPDVLKEEIVQKEWFDAVINSVGGVIVEEGGVEGDGDGDGMVIKAEMKADVENGKFPIKERDIAIAKSFEFLVGKGLVREEESDDDDANYAEMADIEW